MVMCGCTCGNSWRLVAALIAVGGGCESHEPVAAERAPARAVAAVKLAETTLAEEPTSAQPVAWSLAVVPEAVEPGDAIVVEVRTRIAAGWNIHPVGATHGPNLPTKLELALPAGVKAVTEWELPPAWAAADRPEAGPVYQGDATFRRGLIVADGVAAGAMKIRCAVDFQACDATMCRRPEKVDLEATIRIVE